jgi:hypothetical protein
VATELENLADLFRAFADFVSSPLYARLATEVADDPDVTGLLLDAPPAQRWPMLLLAAVHLETLGSGAPYPADGEELAAFCRRHDEALRATIRTRSTQTNEVGRCNYLLPCFAHAADGRPLALVEVGASAGLTLNWDRYRYDYGSLGRVGDRTSPVRLSCEVRGGEPPLAIPPVAWRAGVDLAPRPDDEWLRACIFADQPDRFERLEAALALARDHDPRVIRGDALELLPELVAEAPDDAQVIVYHTAVLAYMEPAATERLRALVRGVTHVSAEYMGQGGGFTLEVDGEQVGLADAHGRWLEWTAA